MKLSSISISPRVCTEAETKALTLWSASFIYFCMHWATTRGLQPPVNVVETLLKVSFNVPSISEMTLKPLITTPLDNGEYELNLEYDRKLEEIATDLLRDLRQLQMFVSHADPHDHKQSFLTESRGLRRFQRAMSQPQFTRIEITASESIIINFFSLERMTLYMPRWLIDVLPRSMFEPNQSLYRARPASLVWLLLDAIVVTTKNEFKTL